MYQYRQKNRERLSDYWMAYYYEKYEVMLPQKLRHKHASLKRQREKQAQKAALD